MKATAWMGAGLLALPLHLAWANGDRTTTEAASSPGLATGSPHDAGVAAPSNPAAEADAPADARPVPRLRDSLRQSADNGSEPFQPYRLSLEERQRMREQLRHHGTIEFRLKP